MNKRDAIEKRHIDGEFDYALPQPWLERIADAYGKDRDERWLFAYSAVLGGTVWHYPETSIWGKPLFLTNLARKIVTAVEH